MTTGVRIDLPREKLADFCHRHHIRKLSLFGSVLRDDFTPESDVDVLIEYDPQHVPGLFGFVGAELELSEILGGRKVDLRTPAALKRYWREEVLAEALPVYVATE